MTNQAIEYTPTRGRVLIKRDGDGFEEHPEMIIIPDYKKRRTMLGTVVAVGREYEGEPVKKGDKVMFGRFSGADLTIGETDFVLCDPYEILAVMEEDSANE